MKIMCSFNLKNLSSIILIVLFLWSSRLGTSHAKEGKHWTHIKDAQVSMLVKNEKGYGNGHNHGRSPAKFTGYNYMQPDDKTTATAPEKSSTTFNVLDYGAKGDGSSNDTKAFEAAWAAACAARASTIVVPAGSVFLVHPVSFSGPSCQPNIVFQLDGKIVAPISPKAWGSGLLQWIEFKILYGITIRGQGIIDGQGSVWWDDSATYDSDSELSSELGAKKMPGTKPTALRFYGSTGVTVTGITIQNSAKSHLKFDSCTAVRVIDFTASSPENSPNTDGIHLQNSRDVVISRTHLACGDDCISIQTGCSNINIHDVNCGPGHGIGIGGLGQDYTKACVSNITVRDVMMQNTLTGVRIKTWQGGSGSVQGIMYSNIQVSGVKIPIMIDQFYCDKKKCTNESAAVAISGINYVNIKGTYTVKPVHFACSDNLPCTGVSLATVQLKPVAREGQPFCWNAYGELKTSTAPPINCLQSGKSRSPFVDCSA